MAPLVPPNTAPPVPPDTAPPGAPPHGFSSGLFADPAFASVSLYAGRLAAFEDWPSVEALDALFRERLAIAPAVALETQRKGRSARRGAARGRSAVYEVRIHTERLIPTRAGSWHDLMNALVWCAFPLAKRALTTRQHAIVARRVSADATALPQTRTREQDALAMLDEGGVLLLHAPEREADLEHGFEPGDRSGIERLLDEPAGLHAALKDGRIALRLFGHALLEAIATGELERRDLRGAVVALAVDAPADAAALNGAAVDAALAACIADSGRFLAPDPARSLWLREALSAANRAPAVQTAVQPR